jgi:hypothetical protein
MLTRKLPVLVAGCAGLWLLLSLSAESESPAAAPDSIDVLAQGPVHEAYAQPVGDPPEAGPVVPKEPPALIDEVPPDQKPAGDNVQWIPGYWQYDDDRKDFIWISGFWRAPPPGRQWVPGYYRKVDDGWQWVDGFWASAGQDEQPLLPPPLAPLDAEPSVPPPSDGSIYVPGCWVYRETRYRWRPGFYIDCRPGWVWIPANYIWTPAGWVFIDGYWDYPLENRGLLFAPVVIERRIITPTWCYTPSYVVAPDFLPCALFERPAWGHYYFGDYFAARYARRGFTAWIDFGIGRHFHDPLYDYYRVAHRREHWDRDLHDLYEGRFRGDIPRPPRTLAQQNDFLKRAPTGADRVSGFRTTMPLAALHQVDPKAVKLASVDSHDRKQFVLHTEQVRDVARQRHEVEAHVLASHAAPTRPGDPPHAVKLNLPLPPQPKTPAKPPAPVVRDDPTFSSPAARKPHGGDLQPKNDTPPPPKHDTALPLPPNHDVPPPPPRHEVPPPPPKQDAPPLPKHDVPPPPKHDTPPPPPKHDAPPPPTPKHDAPPSPPAPNHDPTPPRHDPTPPKHDVPSPPPPKHDPPPPPTHEAPPPPPKHEAPPPPPKHDAPPPPPPMHDVPPPSPPRHDPPAPPPPPKHEAPPPPPPRHDPPPPPPKHEAPPPPPRHDAPTPPKHDPPSQPKHKP